MANAAPKKRAMRSKKSGIKTSKRVGNNLAILAKYK